MKLSEVQKYASSNYPDFIKFHHSSFAANLSKNPIYHIAKGYPKAWCSNLSNICYEGALGIYGNKYVLFTSDTVLLKTLEQSYGKAGAKNLYTRDRGYLFNLLPQDLPQIIEKPKIAGYLMDLFHVAKEKLFTIFPIEDAVSITAYIRNKVASDANDARPCNKGRVEEFLKRIQLLNLQNEKLVSVTAKHNVPVDEIKEDDFMYFPISLVQAIIMLGIPRNDYISHMIDFGKKHSALMDSVNSYLFDSSRALHHISNGNLFSQSEDLIIQAVLNSCTNGGM